MPKLKRNAIIAVAVVVGSLYRFVSPFLDETRDMQNEARLLRLEIAKVHDESDQYSKKWEKKMDEKEKHLLEELPDTLNSSHLLEYLLTRFELMFPGKVVFLQVNRQNTSVTEFKVGDEVFGSPSAWFGTHAEFICVPESAPLAHKPTGTSFEEAAAVFDGAVQALTTLRQADVREGQRIVIYGASGSLGTAAVQLARNLPNPARWLAMALTVAGARVARP